MRKHYFLLLLVIFSFLQATIIPLNLVFIGLSSWAFFRPLRDLYIYGFVVGVLLDFLSARTLGVSAFFFLLFITIIFLIREKFIHTEVPSTKTVIPIFLLLLTLGEALFGIFVPIFEAGPRFFVNWIYIFVQDIFGLVLFPIFFYLHLRWPKEEQLELRF